MSEYNQISWSLILDGFQFQGSGLATGDVVKIPARASTLSETTIGADGDVIKTSDVQAVAGEIVIKVIYASPGELLLRKWLVEQITLTSNGETQILTHSGTATKTFQSGINAITNSYILTSMSMSGSPEDTLRNANADPVNSIVEYTLNGKILPKLPK